MAAKLNKPRTAFHQRMQATNNQLHRITQALQLQSSTQNIIQIILQVNVITVLGHRPGVWEGFGVTAEEPLFSAAEKMQKSQVNTMLVRDEHDVVGMVTRTQVMAALVDNSLDTPLKKCMVKRNDFFCVDKDDTVAAALQEFQRRGVKRLFVIDAAGVLLGILTLGLLIRWLAERLLENFVEGSTGA